MTYRRLFLHLLVTGAVLLAGVWWYSFRTINGFALAVPHRKAVSGGVIGAVHCGTVSFVWNPAGRGSQWFEFHSGAVSELPPADRYGVMGRFLIGPMEEEEEVFPDMMALQLPLWLIYLLVAGAGYALVWWGERRSAASAEKALALRNAGEDVAVESHITDNTPTP